LGEQLKAAAPEEQAGLDFLFGHAHGQRAAAQPLLQEALDPGEIDFHDFLAGTVEAVRPPGENAHETLGELAHPLMLEQLRQLEELASRDLHDYEHLHQVRIAGKQLRYAMEVLAPCYEPPFAEELYPAVEQMQEILGRAN